MKTVCEWKIPSTSKSLSVSWYALNALQLAFERLRDGLVRFGLGMQLNCGSGGELKFKTIGGSGLDFFELGANSITSILKVPFADSWSSEFFPS